LLLAPAAAAVSHVTGPDAQPVAAANVTILSPAGATLAQTRTAADGGFDSPAGLLVEIHAPGFAPYRGPAAAAIQLTLAPQATRINVTATRGALNSDDTAASLAASVTPPQPAAALAGSPGVLLQQTGASQSSPFLRGLTGYQVLNLIDGVRFNNSTFRSGPNQYLAFIEPSQAERIEAVLGPTSAQYGSDALGGTIQLFTPGVRAFDGLHGEWRTFASSADLAAGTSAQATLGGPRLSLLAGFAGRKHNDLRAGGGTDSRHALRRFLNLTPAQIRAVTGTRQQDTAFTQHGAHAKLLARLSATQLLSAWYQHSRMNDVRNSKDLWGGLGRLQSALTPQGLDLGYLRWERVAAGPLDSLSATFSVNSQRDGSIRQGLRASDRVTLDQQQVDSYGWTGQALFRETRRQQLAGGAELYHERIAARRVDGGRPARPLYPDNSRYRTAGLWLQNRADLLPGRLWATGALRYTHAGYRTREDAAFGVAASSQQFQDVTFQTSLGWRVAGPLTWHVLAGRGFRAPNANDLGAVGLNDLGYEIPASQATGALLGNSAGEGALSLGRPAGQLAPERLFNYETGFRLRTARADFRAQAFLADLHDPIVRRTLLFPLGSLPSVLGGLAVTPIAPTAAQLAQSVGTVATAVDPRALKAFVNDGRARYSGLETSGRWQASPHWTLSAAYAFLAGRDMKPNRHIRRLPPQQGSARLRHSRSRWWWEGWMEASGAQSRLSGGDIDDERIGASRSRADIEAFFLGARLGGVSPTGETLAEIQNRVLPGASATQRVALYTRTNGWLTLNTAAGFSLTEQLTLQTAVTNLADRNYRLHGSGIDSPGINALVSLAWRF